MAFEPTNWVWLHLWKERFLVQRHSKLLPRGDGLFQVLEQIIDNAYRLDLLGKYNISATFNVSYFSSFDVGTDLRKNPSQGKGNDEDMARKSINPIQTLIGPVTHS